MDQQEYVHQQILRVKLGASLLDVKKPGWAKTVLGAMTDGYFRMMQWEHCVAGSLELVKYSYELPEDDPDAHTGEIFVVLNGTRIATSKEGSLFGFLPLAHDDSIFGDVDDDDKGHPQSCPLDYEQTWQCIEDCWRREIANRV